ncbi:MAG TPA: hypothetical protein VLR27_16565 [Acidimicrobiales bacterium]|nr:hypothetical protein [Acidimicrobiales bacterium]
MPVDPDHRVVTATIIGVPAPGTVVWRADGERTRDGSPVTGDLDDADEVLRAGDQVVLEVVRDHFRWLVVDVVDRIPRPRTPARPRRPHAHPARPPGTVLIAWLPFTRDDDEGPGKHRPCVVLRSTDPAVIRARPLYDPGSAVARSSGGVQLQAWRAAGLDKASVAVDPVEIPVARCAQTLGHLSPVDLAGLGITGRRQR